MSKPILIVGGIIIVGLGGFFLFQSSNQEPVEEVMEEEMEEPGDEMMMPVMGEEMVDEMMVEHTVVRSDAGYAPNELMIKKGDKVTFRNESSRETWPASAMHPSHTVYPGSGYVKCLDGTSDKSKLFDSCRGLKAGEEWSFVFNEVGTWGYHDHLHDLMYGKIIVQE